MTPDTFPRLDRLTVMPIVMQRMLAENVRPQGDPDEVGNGRLVCVRGGLLAGLPVAKEAFGRMGARCRAVASEGSWVGPDEVVAELGGPLAAIRGAAPLAIQMLERLSAVASGATPPARGDPLEEYATAVRLSSPDPVGDDGPTFRLTIDPGGTTD
jgi:hypothetical protein